MADTSHYPKNGDPITGSCTIPFPKGDENTLQLATRYAQAFSQALSKEHYVVLCAVPIPLAQAITLGAWMTGHPVAYIGPDTSKSQLNHALSLLKVTLKIGSPNFFSSQEDKLAWLTPDVEGDEKNNVSEWLLKHANEDPIVPYEWNDDECAAVLFTSGSTGMPKGVCHSVGNLTRSAHLFIQRFDIGFNDRLLNLAPLHSMSGLRGSVFVPLFTGCQLMNAPKVGDLEDVLNLLRSERPTVFIGGPIFFRQIATLVDKLEDELSSIRLFLCTGAKLDRPSRVKIWDKHRIPIIDYYGLTETTGLIISEKIDHYNPEFISIGKECSGVTVEFTEMGGISDPQSTTGQMRIFSPNLFLGYLGEDLARKRYFDTGDLGVRDEAGNIILKGRIDNNVKASNTRWLFPQAMEQFLVNHPDIADAHVRSEYDKYDRGGLRAKIVPTNPETVDDGWLETLIQDIEDRLGSDYKAVDIEITSAIQRTALGKIIKESD